VYKEKNVNNDQEKSETSNNQVEDDDYGITYEDVKILEAMEEAEKLKQEEKRKLEDGEKLKQEETEIKEKPKTKRKQKMILQETSLDGMEDKPINKTEQHVAMDVEVIIEKKKYCNR